MNNERGNTLITVMLVSLIFTVLGLSILASSIGSVKRTETRESDLDVTYDSIKVLETMTADLSGKLSSLPLDYYMDFENNKVKGSYNTDMRNLLSSLLSDTKKNSGSSFECINIIDVSSGSPAAVDPSSSCGRQLERDTIYTLDTDKDFTRILDFVLVTKNPAETEGKVSRTVKKRIILSPLPSFLKYAVGSEADEEDSGLFLNGSPNIAGNTYANRLAIDEDAHYIYRNGEEKTVSTPKPSLMGDIYSSTSHLLPVVSESKNFYRGQAPPLKHDSQFFNIDFEKTMNQRIAALQRDAKLDVRMPDDTEKLKDIISLGIKKLAGTSYQINPEGYVKKIENAESQTSLTSEDVIPLAEGYVIDSRDEKIEIKTDTNVNGDLVIMSTQFPIDMDSTIIVNGDLYIMSYKDITLSKNIYVTGKTVILNYGEKIALGGDLISAESISAESYKNASLSIKGNIMTGTSLTLLPNETSIIFNKDIITGEHFTINGNETDGSIEDDAVAFDSVVYTGGKASISNANIVGAKDDNGNEQQIILMAKDDLLITRIDEFNKYSSVDEDGEPYLPKKFDKNITPLKGFFYTEKEATLYGVGSLFYIHGGVFAKQKLTINAVRGVTESIDDLPKLQEGKLSRFVVKYDQEVLLKRIETLPIMEQLQVFSDELLVY
ncbi:hypothetical protein [Bacillus infantis]|uniref:hypothetical protein n=1 Tax=Bacillus infantis TaxID=324767 RepID=UPI003CF4AA14